MSTAELFLSDDDINQGWKARGGSKTSGLLSDDSFVNVFGRSSGDSQSILTFPEFQQAPLKGANAKREMLLDLLSSDRFDELFKDVAIETYERSRRSSLEFIRKLPTDKMLPTIAPDGEGDILFVWETERTIIVTVERCMLHVAVGAGTDQSSHFDNLDFSNGEIPIEILEILPQG